MFQVSLPNSRFSLARLAMRDRGDRLAMLLVSLPNSRFSRARLAMRDCGDRQGRWSQGPRAPLDRQGRRNRAQQAHQGLLGCLAKRNEMLLLVRWVASAS